MKRTELKRGDKIRTKDESVYKSVPIGSTGVVTSELGCIFPCNFHARTDFDGEPHCFSYDSIQVLRSK